MSASSRRNLLTLLIGGGVAILAKADSAVLKGARKADDVAKGSDDVAESGAKYGDEYDVGAKQGDEADDAGKASDEQKSGVSLIERVVKKKSKKEIRKKAVKELTNESGSGTFFLEPTEYGVVQINTDFRTTVEYEFWTSDDYPIDIFLFTYDQYLNYQFGSSARTITQGTVLDTNQGKEKVELEANEQYYLIVDHTSFATQPETDMIMANVEVSLSM